MIKLQRTIFWLFAALFFFVPLVLWPFTSEVFEFNKMVFVYILTTLIVASWAVRSILERKIIFRRTTLDVPLLVFLGSQLISALLSIDPLTSWLGYYSRFNGGFASTICYSLLYWAFVSNFDRDDTLKLINYSLLPSALLVSLYGVLEHFGIDKSIWVQDVQSRVFSTLGQPNWLAAWLVALMPISWSLMLESGSIKQESRRLKFMIRDSKFLIHFFLSILFFWTLIFTKSRSGLLGFTVAFAIFWGFYLWSNRKEYKKVFVPSAIIISSFLIIILISGTQFTPSVYSLFNHSTNQPANPAGPALETGGTESGTIRKIVWKGAFDVWRNFPVFGTGPETFAFSYYMYRPPEHNLVSEWDFIYNKAHNEFLNVAANTGSVGLLAYLFLIGASIYQILKVKNQKLEVKNTSKNSKPENFSFLNCDFNFCLLPFALLAGYASLLVTNFFGFSVVPTQLEFFLFPAIAIVLSTEYAVPRRPKEKISITQKISAIFVLCTVIYVLFSVGKYWYSDILYNKGKSYNSIKKPDIATKYLAEAASLEPNQPLYRSELAGSYTSLATAFQSQKDTNNAQKFTGLAINESETAGQLSPANINLKRARFAMFIMLATTNPNYLESAGQTLLEAISQAPTDAKLYYNLGLIYARTGQLDKALETLKKTIELKANYKDARLAYAYLLIDKKDFVEAKVQLNYIFKNIDPNDSLTKQALESIR